MLLSTLYIRFFRSFNFDYLRKSDLRVVPKPWDDMRGMFYPYVEVDLDKNITTIVGANESGKSQLLSAIKFLLKDGKAFPRDFCRYSHFFTVDDKMTLPEFGGRFTHLSVTEVEAIKGITNSSEPIDQFYLFRTNQGVHLYLSKENGAKQYPLSEEQISNIDLPSFSEIDPNIPLPDSVPIEYLASSGDRKSGRSRRKMFRAQKAFREHYDQVVADVNPQQPNNNLVSFVAAIRASNQIEEESYFDQRLKLAETLLVEVAGIDKAAFSELQEAARQDEGFANNIVKKMNEKLSDALNFQKWWSQDDKFSLQLSLRDFDLVFTVKDRTNSDYAFSERSEGMKYFLSYFVQYLSYKRKSDNEILLMDEPDRFLSTSGQQDLLRIFDKFANPDDPKRKPVQVVYVTHSPFLIDKNHSDRIRVIEKGEGDEGTRIVNNASKNHYEPLRSAFGSFVAETTFIGSCNLMLEGQADQVLLASISSLVYDLRPKDDALDLNGLTLVPAGSAGHIPYLVYLSRGRDVEKPALIVLLDGDAAGLEAKRELNKGFRGRLLDPEYVILTSDLDVDVEKEVESVQEIEDLIPSRLATCAIRRVAKEILGKTEADLIISNLKPVKIKEKESLFDAAARTALEAGNGRETFLRLDKVAFARAVSEAIREKDDGWDVALSNFIVLFGEINSRQRKALSQQNKDRLSSLMNQLKSSFLRDYPNGALKSEVQAFLEKIESKLPELSEESEYVRDMIREIRTVHKLKQEPRAKVEDFDELKKQLESLTYSALRGVQINKAHPDVANLLINGEVLDSQKKEYVQDEINSPASSVVKKTKNS